MTTWAEANARRLARHGLTSPLASFPEAAAASAGIHAQVMSAAEVSLALRVADTTRSDVATALWEERSLVKTFGPRGTVHVLPAADLPWWLAALDSMPKSGGHPDGVRLLPDETDAVVAALDTALREEDRTTEELDTYVAEACGPWAAEESMAAFGGFWPRWRLALDPAAVRGVLCFGPNRGRKITYASPSRWLAGWSLPDPADARRTCSALTWRVRPGDPRAPGAMARHVAGLGQGAVRAGRPRRGRARGRAGMGVEPATPRSRARSTGGAAAALLRRLPGRLAAARAAVPGSGVGAGPGGRSGRQLPGAAARRGGRRRLAPEAVRPSGEDHGRAAGSAHQARAPCSRSRSSGSARSSGAARPHRGAGDRRPARLRSLVERRETL